MKGMMIVVLQSGAISIKSKWNARVYLKMELPYALWFSAKIFYRYFHYYN